MKRILINATHNEEIRVALCKGNHLYDFDLENRTREQKKSNIYKGHVTRVEPSLEAVFVEYGSQRQGFLPIREIANEYLKGNARDENIRKLIKEGDELIVQVEKEERGNKGAALSTYVSLAGRYLVLMPNNPRGGGISRQISGKLREDMKRMLSNLDLPKGMSVIIRTAGIGKTQEDLQHDLNHLLNIWEAIQEQNKKYPSPRLVHQEAGVVTRAVRDYLRDDIAEIWIDNENAYIEAASFIEAVMPTQADKLRKYTDFEPMFARFGIEKQIETAYQREVRLPSGGSIVIDQTEALVSIDINSAKSTKGSDVAETAYHTNLEAADEIARQLRLRDMGGLIVIDFIDMNDSKHQKDVEKRLVDATKYDRARVQFGDISRFGLMEMSRQRLRPSLEESTGYICPRCHGNGMIRDLRSLSLSIMRQIEQIALKERQGEVQAEVPTDIAAFLLNEKRDSLVYLEQDSGTRITILPHAHLDSPNFKLHFNRDGFAPSSYERITDTQQQEFSELGYDVDWQTADKERPEQQPTRQPRQVTPAATAANPPVAVAAGMTSDKSTRQANAASAKPMATTTPQAPTTQPQAVAWLSNLFAPTPQATTADSISSQAAAEAIEAIVNSGAQSLGAFGQVNPNALAQHTAAQPVRAEKPSAPETHLSQDDEEEEQEKRRRKSSRKPRPPKARSRRDKRDEGTSSQDDAEDINTLSESKSSSNKHNDARNAESNKQRSHERTKRPSNSRRDSRGEMPRGETLTPEAVANDGVAESADDSRQARSADNQRKADGNRRRQDRSENSNKASNPNEVSLQVNEAPARHKEREVVHLSLDDSKSSHKADTKSKPADSKSDRSDSQLPQSAADNKPTKDPKIVSHADQSVSEIHTAETLPEEATQQVATQSQDSAASVAQVETKDETEQSVQAEEREPTEQTVNQPEASNQPEQNQQAATQPGASEQPETDLNTANAVAEVASNSEVDAVQQNEVAEIAAPYDPSTLFADRYVTANKFGLASNDPRQVLAKQAQNSANNTATTTKPVADIQGTVGEFIHAVLPDASTYLSDKGVIASFIAAVAAFQAQAATDSTQASLESPQDNPVQQAFDFSSMDFSNYGYAPLDASYLGRFATMTQAVAQIAIAQGKTDVSPRPISKRAANDPRGQHPDYQAKDDVFATTPSEHGEANALAAESQVEAVTSESEALLVEDAKIMPTLKAANAEQPDLPMEQSTSAETMEQSTQSTASDISDNTANVSQESSDNDEANDADANAQLAASATGDTSNPETTDNSGAAAEGVAAEKVVEETPQSAAAEGQQATASAAEGEAATPSKTTIASYKNMIENVAEQLLPQPASLFNLTTPKVPKSRSRKVKSEPKKSAAADKASSKSEPKAKANGKDKTANNKNEEQK